MIDSTKLGDVISGAISDALMTSSRFDGNGQLGANVTDGLFAIADAIWGLADAIKSLAEPPHRGAPKVFDPRIKALETLERKKQ